MKLSTNVIIQIIGVAIQLVDQFGSLVPAKWKPVVSASVGIAQGVVALMAHFSNPDGTPAEAAYVKGGK